MKARSWQVDSRPSNTWWPGSRTEQLPGLGSLRGLQKSPTLKDLERIIGYPHAPQGVQHYRQLDVLRPETVPEPEWHRPVAVRSESSYSTRGCLRGMVIPRDADAATPCDVSRLTAQVATLQIGAGVWRLFWHRMRSISSKLSRRTSANISTSQKKSDKAGRDAENRVNVQMDMFMGKVIRNLLKATKKWG